MVLVHVEVVVETGSMGMSGIRRLIWRVWVVTSLAAFLTALSRFSILGSVNASGGPLTTIQKKFVIYCPAPATGAAAQLCPRPPTRSPIGRARLVSPPCR